MPVKPENRNRYPANWSELVEACKQRTIQANGMDCCEGSPDFPDCRRPNGWLLNKRTGELTGDGAWAISSNTGGMWDEPDFLSAAGAWFFDDWCFADEPTRWMHLPPDVDAALPTPPKD